MSQKSSKKFFIGLAAIAMCPKCNHNYMPCMNMAMCKECADLKHRCEYCGKKEIRCICLTEQ